LSPSTFRALGAPDDLVARLAARNITEPSPIQHATIPPGLAGRDVCGRAPTGSGKTIAFGIPLVTRVTPATSRRPHGLVLVPTRELAAQVAAELRNLAGPGGPSVIAVHGGVGFGPQIDKLRRGVDIVVACPGRLTDLVQQNHVRLDDVEFVVIDEADRLADMGFLPTVRRLLDTVPPSRQMLLFSATLDGAVDVLVQRYQRDPVRHELGDDKKQPPSRHLFWQVERGERVSVLADVLAANAPAIVFCRTKHGVDRLERHLARSGVSVASIHGNRSQAQRTRALAAFTTGKVHALIATDVAARGIHVDDVAVVVHFDAAGSDNDYVHRSGRTGRAGRAGLVISFVAADQHAAASAMQRRLGLQSRIDQPSLERPRRESRPERAVSRTAATPRTGPARRGRDTRRSSARSARSVRRSR
jgi:superfamily II DNA/RNA helicase